MNSNLIENGYFVAPEVLSEGKRSHLESELPHTNSAGTRLLLGIKSFSRFAIELKGNPALACSLKGLSAIQCILFDKNRARNWSVQSHRDTVVPVKGSGPWPSAGSKEGLDSARPPFEFLGKCLAVRVALDECPEGDLDISPCSHLATDGENANFTSVVVPKCGALIFRPTLLHASRKLVKSRSRRVLHFLFAPSKPPHNYRWHYSV